MSIGAGTFTLTRLQVLAKPNDLDIGQLLQGLRSEAIVPIEMDDCVEERVGWCHPYSGEPDFSDAQDWLHGEHLVFGLRIDQKKVPGTLFKLQLRSLLEEMARSHARASKAAPESRSSDQPFSGEQGRKLKDLARDRVKTELLKRTLPSIRLVETVWNLQTTEIWITSSSQGVFDAFDVLFQKSFSLPYVFKTCGTLGVDFDLFVHGIKDESDTLERLTQCVPWGALGQNEEVQTLAHELPFEL